MIKTSRDQCVIQFDDVSVRYRVPKERVSGIKEFAIRWLQRRLEYEDLWALKDISFEVMKGEVFGVIGRNGSGKTTMLKVMAKVLHPTKGRVRVNGGVAPLLGLGAGFHNELTGRENIFLNLALLGYPKNDVEALLPDIIEFAEIPDFVDAPIRTYSTGMVARLGFAVATSVRPDILLVDEVLAVGDNRFQKKCLDRMYDFQEQGTTIVIVSHSMSTLEGFCDRGLWLDHGKIKHIGSAPDIAQKYIAMGRSSVPQPEEEARMTEVPVLEVSTPQAEPLAGDSPDYVLLPEVEHVYPAAQILNLLEGSVCVLLRFHREHAQHMAVLFHSDDSRYVLYSNSVPASGSSGPTRIITARAGGNRKAIDPFIGKAVFSEVSVQLDGNTDAEHTFPYDEWHLVTMTWTGYPEGQVSLYLDDVLMGGYRYTRQHDNAYRLAIQVAVGIRPREWVGELVQREDGTVAELHPQAANKITASGKEIKEMRLYRKALNVEEIQGILSENNIEPG